jgi:hypothetical protein
VLNLLAAIQSAFAGNSAFATITNGLENGEGADLEVLPNCILVEVSCVPTYMTRGTYGIPYSDNCMLMFTFRASSGDQVATYVSALRSQFDHKTLALSGGEVLRDARYVGGGVVYREDEKTYRADPSYKFVVDGCLP